MYLNYGHKLVQQKKALSNVSYILHPRQHKQAKNRKTFSFSQIIFPEFLTAKAKAKEFPFFYLCK